MSSLEGCRTADPRDTFAFPLQCFYQCTFCHCVYFLPLHQCTVPLLCTIVHCTAVLFAIAPLCCSIATMLHFIGTFHLTIALFLSMHTLPLHLRPLQLLSLHFYLESLFLLTLQYIHYPNIHYQNVARSIINTYIYALQSVDKSIQAQFSARNWVSTLPRSFCTFTISHLSVGHFCKMSEILSFIASLLTERSLPWISDQNLIGQTIRNIMILSFAAIHTVTNYR